MRVLDLAPFSNVAAGQKATASFDNLIGLTVDQIILELSGVTKAQLDNIKLIAGEKSIFEDTGSRVDSRMQYRGIAASAAYLALDFSEIMARSQIGEHLGSIDTVTAGIKKLTAEIDINAAAAGPVIMSAFALVSPGNQPQVLKANGIQAPALYGQLIGKVFSRTWNPGGAGEFAFDMSYARKAGTFIKRVFMFGATVSAARVKKNGGDMLKETSARASFFQTAYGRTPQANILALDFVVDGNQSDAMGLADATAMEWYVTTTGAGNITIVTELLDVLGNN